MKGEVWQQADFFPEILSHKLPHMETSDVKSEAFSGGHLRTKKIKPSQNLDGHEKKKCIIICLLIC